METKFERYLFLVLLIVVITFVMGSFIPSIMMGIILAIAIYPIEQRIFKTRSEKIKTSLVTVALTLIMVLPFVALVTFGAIKGKEYLSETSSENITKYTERSFKWIEAQPFGSYVLTETQLDAHKYKQVVDSNLQKLKIKAYLTAQAVATSIPAALISFLLVMATVYFGILDGKSIKKSFIDNNFYSPQFGKFIVNEFVSASRAVILSSLGCAVAQSLCVAVPALIFDMPNFFSIVFISFFLSMIPLIGTTPVFIFVFISHFAQEQYTAILVYTAFALIVGIIDNIIRALIINKSNKIHPFIAFMAAIGGIQAMGFFGLFLGPVMVITVLKSFTYVAFRREEPSDVQVVSIIEPEDNGSK